MVKRMARTYSKRTDPHRPGAIIPAEYEYVFSFNLSTTHDGWPVPSYRVNCELDGRTEERDAEGKYVRTVNGEHHPDGNCCVIGLRQVKKERFALDGGPGKCTVCGAHYVHGDAWRHLPTGEIIFLGHDCADKYHLLADRSEAELAALRAKEGAARAASAERTRLALVDFYAAHPGLEVALALTPPPGLTDRELGKYFILSELRDKLRQYRDLSDKQIALAFRLAKEITSPAPAEVMVPAPTGKTTFRGTVISTKVVDGAWGSQCKMTVKVTTPSGVWLAWGTEPAALFGQAQKHGNRLKGAEVEITATLKPGREPHFAIMGRPRGKVVTFPCEHPESCEGCQRALLGDDVYEVKWFVLHHRSEERNARERGLFDQAVYAQWFADEAERTGRLPAADLSGRTPDYVWYRAHEGKALW
jgi:hypothetical protein